METGDWNEVLFDLTAKRVFNGHTIRTLMNFNLV